MASKLIREVIKEDMSKLEATHISDTSIWSVHTASVHNPKTKANKHIKSLPAPKENEVYVIIAGEIGRSGHSSTPLMIFKTDKDNKSAQNAFDDRPKWIWSRDDHYMD